MRKMNYIDCRFRVLISGAFVSYYESMPFTTAIVLARTVVRIVRIVRFVR
jgi:hypothetical protein